MLWSQIKLTSYDFTDLHITGEFDNRLGNGRFLRIFSCVVTYRTGAGRRLTSADARPGTVRRCKRSAGHLTVPGRFYANFQVQSGEFIYIKNCHNSSKKQFVKIKKIEADFDIDGDGNHTCSGLQTIQKHLFVAC